LMGGNGSKKKTTKPDKGGEKEIGEKAASQNVKRSRPRNLAPLPGGKKSGLTGRKPRGGGGGNHVGQRKKKKKATKKEVWGTSPGKP